MTEPQDIPFVTRPLVPVHDPAPGFLDPVYLIWKIESQRIATPEWMMSRPPAYLTEDIRELERDIVTALLTNSDWGASCGRCPAYSRCAGTWT